MYPTYAEMLKVSQDTTLTPSQKMHELFKNSKTRPLSSYIKRDEYLGYPLSPNLNLEAAVVEINAGQTYTLRYPDNTYHILDTGTYEEIDGVDYIAVTSLEELDTTDEYFQELLATEDTPLPFYQGGFVDEDLQSFFLNSYPK
jgi:hypothetical protein